MRDSYILKRRDHNHGRDITQNFHAKRTMIRRFSMQNAQWSVDPRDEDQGSTRAGYLRSEAPIPKMPEQLHAESDDCQLVRVTEITFKHRRIVFLHAEDNS